MLGTEALYGMTFGKLVIVGDIMRMSPRRKVSRLSVQEKLQQLL